MAQYLLNAHCCSGERCGPMGLLSFLIDFIFKIMDFNVFCFNFVLNQNNSGFFSTNIERFSKYR